MGGFNTTFRVPYIAIPPSFDNTRKNLIGRNEIPKKKKIIAPLVGESGSEKTKLKAKFNFLALP